MISELDTANMATFLEIIRRGFYIMIDGYVERDICRMMLSML